MTETAAQQHFAKYREYLIKKYGLSSDATWGQIENALEVHRATDQGIAIPAGVARCGCAVHRAPCEHDRGYAAGRSGELLAQNASDAFRVGWDQGNCAAEASSNSFQSWGY